MGLRDSVKRSLGYEVEENNRDEAFKSNTSVLGDFAKGVSDTISNSFNGADFGSGDYGGSSENYDYDDYSISPNQSLYELLLIRPKTEDDINYVVDQVLDNNNPVIIDLSFLERESPADFKLAGEKIKKMRMDYGVESFLISRCNNRNMIIVAPSCITIIKKD